MVSPIAVSRDASLDRWTKRFETERLVGLFSRHAGRERYKVTDRLEARVLARTTRHKPPREHKP